MLPTTSEENRPVESSETAPPRTVEDLYAIRNFLRDRANDEHRDLGGLTYYLGQGVTLQPKFPKGYEGFRDSAEEFIGKWLEAHSPRRQAEVASAVADLADEVVLVVEVQGGSFIRERAWAQLVKAASLWREHPDYKSSWE